MTITVTKCDNSISHGFLTYFVLKSVSKWFYYKVWQTVVIKCVRWCDRMELQSALDIIMCDRLLLQSLSGIT